MFRLLFGLFIIVPLVEIYFLLRVGDIIGAGWTVFAVVGTAILGAGLLRVQGASTLLRAQSNALKGQLPAMEMMEGVALAASGLLLLTPGFVTDTIGFILLTPPLRRGLIKLATKNSKNKANWQQTMHQPGSSSNDETIIEGEIVAPDDDLHLR